VVSGCEDGEISGSNFRDLGKCDELMERFSMSWRVLIWGTVWWRPETLFWHLVAKNQFDHRIRDNRRMETDEILFEVVISYGNKLYNVGLTFVC
jgi:hypothetical protein